MQKDLVFAMKKTAGLRNQFQVQYGSMRNKCFSPDHALAGYKTFIYKTRLNPKLKKPRPTNFKGIAI